jgi:hypothetical protein
MAPSPTSDLFFAPEIEEHRKLVKWWKQAQKNPFERNLVVRLMYEWSDDQCRNGALVIAVMRIRALYFGSAAIFVRCAMIAFGSSRSRSVYTLQALTLAAFCMIKATRVLHDSNKPETSPTVTTVFRVGFALFGVGTFFLGVIGGIATAISCHIIWRVSRSLRVCRGNAALVYIPPVALVFEGPQFTWRPPFYEPEPFIQCDDPRELARRIRALDSLL